MDRPKQGFGIPLADWLRGPLLPWAEALITKDRLATHGLIEEAYVRRLWEEHQSKQRNWAQRLWNILIFQSWFEHQELA